LIEQLQGELQKWERGSPRREGDVCSTGSAALDRWLPEGGLRRGTVVVWVGGARGCGVGVGALGGVGEGIREGGGVVVLYVGREGDFILDERTGQLQAVGDNAVEDNDETLPLPLVAQRSRSSSGRAAH